MVAMLDGAASIRAQIEAPSAKLARRCRKLARQIRGGSAMFRGAAGIISAAQLELDGREDAAIQTWQRAREELAAADCRAHVAAIDSHLGQLLDGEASQAAATKAKAYFERERIHDVEGLIMTLAPAPARR